MRSADNVEQTIARYIVNTQFEDLPSDAISATKEHILHTLGTVLAGSSAPGETAWAPVWAGRPDLI